MKVKNFANFILWNKESNIGYGHIEDLVKEAEAYAVKFPDEKFEICAVAFDRDIDDPDAEMVKGQVILSYKYDSALDTIFVTSL